MTKITNGQQTSKIILNELGNKELRKRHSYSLDKGENSPFHHMKVNDQTPIDKLLIEKTISIDQHHVGTKYTEIVFKSGAYLKSPSWEFRDMKNNHTPPPPPTRALILTGEQKYLQKQASPKKLSCREWCYKHCFRKALHLLGQDLPLLVLFYPLTFLPFGYQTDENHLV